MQRKFFSILGITFMIALFFPQIIFAEDKDAIETLDIQIPALHIEDIGVPFLAGTGCKDVDSYSFTQAPSGRFFFKFYEYLAETDNYNRWDSKYCDLMIPVKMEMGYQLGIGKVRYQGQAYIPTRGSGELRRTYFFGSDSGETHVYNVPKKGEKYDFTVEDGDAAVVWTGCGGWVDASINTIITAERPYYSYTQATMSLSSETVDLKMMLEPQVRPCE